MQIQIQAIYENGVLKPEQPLPLEEHQRVTVVIQKDTKQGESATKTTGGIRDYYGIIGWKGDPSILRMLAEDPEYGIEESP